MGQRVRLRTVEGTDEALNWIWNGGLKIGGRKVTFLKRLKIYVLSFLFIDVTVYADSYGALPMREWQ